MARLGVIEDVEVVKDDARDVSRESHYAIQVFTHKSAIVSDEICDTVDPESITTAGLAVNNHISPETTEGVVAKNPFKALIVLSM
eukprot:4862345-Heterocapsa_arctica.AAC.1